MAKRILVFSVIVALAFALAAPFTQAQTTKWKLQTLWSAGEPPYKYLVEF